MLDVDQYTAWFFIRRILFVVILLLLPGHNPEHIDYTPYRVSVCSEVQSNSKPQNEGEKDNITQNFGKISDCLRIDRVHLSDDFFFQSDTILHRESILTNEEVVTPEGDLNSVFQTFTFRR